MQIKSLMITLLIVPYRIYARESARLKAFYFTTKVKLICESYQSVRANERTSVTKKLYWEEM